MWKKETERENPPKLENYNQETETSLLLSIKQNLEGLLGWKFLLLWRSWLEGLMTRRRNSLMEFAFASMAKSHWTLLDESLSIWSPAFALFEFLWKLHLKEPGWFVGEHKHERVEECDFGFEAPFFVAME